MSPQASERVNALNEEYGSARASFARLLCDRHDPEAVAFTVVDGDSVQDFTYDRLRRDSTMLANALSGLGIAAGDRVATLLRKGPELLTVMLAAWRIGAVYTPLFTAFAAPAIDYRMRTADVKLVVTDPEQRPKLVPSEGGDAPWHIVTVGGSGEHGDLVYEDLATEADDREFEPYVQGGEGPVVHVFTSGTTGAPKGVVHPLRYAANWLSYLEFGLGVTDDDVYWCAADPGWAYGLYAGVVAPLAAGTRMILQTAGFSPSVSWSTIERLGVTNFTAAPTAFRAMRQAMPESLGSLRLRKLSSAGEPLTPEVNEWASRDLGLLVHDHYGQTEVGMIFANHHHPELEKEILPGSMGQPLPGWTTVVIAEHGSEVLDPGSVGRIAIDVEASPMMTFTDYQDTNQTAARFSGDGRYYVLGDLGAVDEQDYYRFASRDDDVIIMSGYRIGPFEVESVISRHPAVAECAVIAAPDEIRGEVIEAYVLLRAGESESTMLAEEIQELVRGGYARHAYPRTVHFVDSLPKTPSGKIQRFVLRQRRRAEVENGDR